MSAQLKKEAASQASFLGNAKRQAFQSVPPVPSTISLVGKTVLVTGSNVGLGLGCVQHFLKLRPSRLIMAARSLENAEKVAKGLRTQFPETKIEVWKLDMASFDSVQAFAARCEQELDRLHVAVLNAALGKSKFELTGEGPKHETTMFVNYLATALLVLLLIPKMKPTASSSGPGRLTVITSDASLGVKLEDPGEGSLLDSFDRPEKFDGFQQYANSKLLITMFIARLAEAVSPDQVILNVCNPGATKGTSFFREIDSWVLRTVLGLLVGILGRQTVDASRSYVHSSVVLGKESHGSWTDWVIRP